MPGSEVAAAAVGKNATLQRVEEMGLPPLRLEARRGDVRYARANGGGERQRYGARASRLWRRVNQWYAGFRTDLLVLICPFYLFGFVYFIRNGL